MKENLLRYVRNKELILIVLLGFMIRMYFFVSLRPWDDDVIRDKIIVGDAMEYHPLALSIISNGSFEAFTSIRTPGYPVFVALVYAVSGNSIWMVLLVQIFLSLISTILVYRIMLMFFSRSMALIAAFLFALDITQAIWTIALYSDTLFVTFFLLSIFYLCKGIKEKIPWPLFVSAMFLGVTTLVRPTTYLFPFVAALVILALFRSRMNLRIAQSLVFGAIYLITISPWLIRNYNHYGNAKLSSLSGFNLLLYFAGYTESYKTGKSIKEVRKEFNEEAYRMGADTVNIHNFRTTEIYSEIAKDYIKENFFIYCKRHFMGIINLYAGIGTSKISSFVNTSEVDPYGGPGIIKRAGNFLETKSRAVLMIAAVLGIYLLFNYVFSLYGLFITLKQKERIVILFAMIILYFTMITGVIGYDRYRMPFMPFINMLCAVGVYNLYLKFSHRRLKVKDPYAFF